MGNESLRDALADQFFIPVPEEITISHRAKWELQYLLNEPNNVRTRDIDPIELPTDINVKVDSFCVAKICRKTWMNASLAKACIHLPSLSISCFQNT